MSKVDRIIFKSESEYGGKSGLGKVKKNSLKKIFLNSFCYAEYIENMTLFSMKNVKNEANAIVRPKKRPSREGLKKNNIFIIDLKN